MNVILLATWFVAYANGANDNFKGVATLLGSGTASYRKSLFWATATTFAGSVTAIFIATKLTETFSGKGLVPDVIASNPLFIAAVILGAGFAVLIGVLFGIPVSTTHALTGALLGAGWLALKGHLVYFTLWKIFFLPLIAAPFISVALTMGIYPFFRWMRVIFGITKKTCLCIGKEIVSLGTLEGGQILSSRSVPSFKIFVDDQEACEVKAREMYAGEVFGISAQSILDQFHFLSAGAVSFARGMNDTPKIAALSLASHALGLGWNISGVAFMMALGGLMNAQKVAKTMATRVTEMNSGQGLSANLVTAFLVIFASGWGIPVSTTHVSCGSLFGIGIVNGKARWKIISGIFSAWILTLPVAATLSGLCYYIFSKS